MDCITKQHTKHIILTDISFLPACITIMERYRLKPPYFKNQEIYETSSSNQKSIHIFFFDKSFQKEYLQILAVNAVVSKVIFRKMQVK